jgi:hypothetical protein
MKALLYIRLLTDDQTIVYQNSLLEQVKKKFPDVAVLDVDSQSGELVVHYAKKLLQDATQVIVCLDSATADAGFGSIFSLLELLLEWQKEQLILFRNNHNRLLRMVQARPELEAKVVQDDVEFLQEVQRFYS